MKHQRPNHLAIRVPDTAVVLKIGRDRLGFKVVVGGDVNGGTEVAGQRALRNDWRKATLLGYPDGGSWSAHADQGPPHPPTPVCRAFEPSECRVELCGHSARYMIDQIALWRITGKGDLEMPGEAALFLSSRSIQQ
jgi:hypothetical protein